MRVLVTGATGFIGDAFLARTSGNGNYSLRAAFRSDIPCGYSNIEKVIVEGLTATADWRVAVNGCHAVVHAAARTDKIQGACPDLMAEFRRVNVQGTLNLARQAAEAGVKRFVFVSSIKVNGERTLPGQPYTTDDLPAPVDPYGMSKYEAENGLRQLMTETGMEVVILRPPLVYGPGVKANFFKLLQLTEKRLPIPLRSVQNRRSMVCIGNLVSAIRSCLVHTKAAGETFLISDGEDISTAELFRKLASAMGHKAILLPIPLTVLKMLFSLAGKRDEIDRLTGSLCVDSSKLRKVLNWQQSYTLDQGIEETVDWYVSCV